MKAEVKERTLNGESVAVSRFLVLDGTSIILRPLLSRLIQRCYNATTSVETDPELNIIFQKVIKFYIAPHVYPGGVKKDDPCKETPLLPEEERTIRKIVEGLWEEPGFKAKAFAKLRYVIHDQEVNNNPKSQSDFGKCAETYPAVGVGYVCSPPLGFCCRLTLLLNHRQYYFPSPDDYVQHIKGFALEVRAIGNTHLFRTEGFSLASLRKVEVRFSSTPNAPFAGCNRYPCKSCRRVLPMFGIPAGLQDGHTSAPYDRDIDTADVQPW
jgi:hypothetical protein